MCEVCSIVSAWPIVAITSDPTNPFSLSPSTLLTQRTSADIQPFVDLNPKDMYKEQWRRVQYLAERFWNRWKQEYLQTLQPRRKWQYKQTNSNLGDIFLLKDPESHRNNWLGMVENAFCGKDGRVRKAEVCITKNGLSKINIRPVTELVLLLSVNGDHKDTLNTDRELRVQLFNMCVILDCNVTCLYELWINNCQMPHVIHSLLPITFAPYWFRAI